MSVTYPPAYAPSGPPGDPPPSSPFTNRPTLDYIPTGANALSFVSKPTSTADLGAFASISQILYSLQYAKFRYLSGDYSGAASILSWLQDITAGSPGTQVPVPGQIGCPTPSGTRPTAAEWASIQTLATTLCQRMLLGFDYFGQPMNYVPPFDSQSLFQLIDASLIPTVANVEGKYNTYWAQANVAGGQVTALNANLSAIKGTVAALQSTLAALTPLQQALENDIKALNAKLPTLLNKVHVDNAAFTSAVTNLGNGCSLTEVLTIAGAVVSLASVVFGNVSGIVTAIGALESLESIASLAAAGELIVKQVTTIAGDVGNISAAWNKFKSVIPADPAAPPPALMAISQPDFDQLISKFDTAMAPYLADADPIVSNAAKEYSSSVHQYIATTQARNGKMLLYTASIQKQSEVEADIEQRTLEAERVGTAVTALVLTSAPLVECEVFMQRALNAVTDDAVRELFMARQALEYATLTPLPFDVASADSTSLMTISAGLKVVAQNASPGQRSVLFPDPASPEIEPTLTLSRAICGSSFDDFLKSGSLTFVVDDDLNPFPVGMASITLTGAAVSVTGLSVPAGEARGAAFNLNHCGCSKIQDPSGVWHDYVHASLNALTALNSDGKAIADMSSNFGSGGGEFLSPSPFTVWTLTVDLAQQTWVDISAVTEVRIKYYGFFLPAKPH